LSEIQFSTRKSVLYSLILTLTGLGLIEGAARFTQPGMRAVPMFLVRQIDSDIDLPFMEADPELFWKPLTGYSGAQWDGRVTIDATGLRTTPSPKAAPTRRLLCFGDSITFGYGVDDKESYPAVLASLLEPIGIEVRNAGVTGYTSYQTARWLRRQLQSQHVDDVTLLIGWNDLTMRPITDAEFGSRLRASTSNADEVLRHLAIYRWMKATWLRRGFRETGQQSRTTARVPIEDYARNLEQFVAEARAAGATPRFISLPRRLPKGAEPYHSPYMDTLARVAERLSVPLLLVGKLSDSHPDIRVEGNASLFIDSLHFSPEGNRLMAGLIADQLKAALGRKDQ
jgi:lysophospholipase L1-like esterase